MAAIVRDGGAGRRRTLAADDLGLALALVPDDHRHVAAGAAQVRLHHLQREGRGDARIEGVAAALQDAHADRGADPVRGGHTPNVPSISGRVVNWPGLMLDMRMSHVPGQVAAGV